MTPEKKNGNVQHLRDHAIEPHEAEECFRHLFFYKRDERRFDNVYVLDGRTDRGLYFKIKAMVSRECLRVGTRD